MRILIFLLIFISTLFELDAQSLFWNTSTNDKGQQGYRRTLMTRQYDDTQPDFSAFKLSQNSFFTGAGTSYSFDFGDRDTFNNAFDNRFAVTGDLILNLIPSIEALGSVINIPFRGNIQGFLFGQDLDATYQLGVYPFMQLPETNASVDWILHIGFEGRINPVEEGFEESRRDIRIFGGIESAIYIKDNSKPLVIGLSPVYEKIMGAGGGSFGFEGNLVFEITDGIALAGRAYLAASGSEYRESGGQIGIALTGPSKGN